MVGRIDEEAAGASMFRTNYDGPTRLSTLNFGPKSIVLARPDDPDRLLSDPGVLALNRQDDYMPYWAYLWPGAYLLADQVARETWMEGTKALEIGCGLGLAGLVGVASGLRVDFTDYDEAPLLFVRKSLSENGFPDARAATFCLDWRSPGTRRYPLILGADVLYEERLVPLVCDVIKALLEPEGLALVAGPYRVATEGLEDCLKSRGLRAESESLSSHSEELGPVRGTLHRIRHRD